jgi:hypothetical protein
MVAHVRPSRGTTKPSLVLNQYISFRFLLYDSIPVELIMYHAADYFVRNRLVAADFVGRSNQGLKTRMCCYRP